MLDYIVGLQPEMNELVEGSYLVESTSDLKDLVLPMDQKASILRTVSNYHKFFNAKDALGLTKEVCGYGTGLVLLFWGASGTGKTFCVNALAHDLGKKMLMVNFELLQKVSSLSLSLSLPL